jgi:hypothetical protein
MGMVPPTLPSFVRRRLQPQTKEEHPMQEIRDHAEEVGQIRMPPQGGGVFAPPSDHPLLHRPLNPRLDVIVYGEVGPELMYIP